MYVPLLEMSASHTALTGVMWVMKGGVCTFSVLQQSLPWGCTQRNYCTCTPRAVSKNIHCGVMERARHWKQRRWSPTHTSKWWQSVHPQNELIATWTQLQCLLLSKVHFLYSVA